MSHGIDGSGVDGVIAGGQVLSPDGSIDDGVVAWSGSDLVEVAPGADLAGLSGSADVVIDAAGALVMPGLVDVHGDAFERSLMPRPNVAMPIDLALAENDHALAAAGITTSYLSATDSWEPGLRSRATLRELVGAIARRPPGVDVRLHVRHEQCNTDDLDELVEWLEDGTVTFLSFNDHAPKTAADAAAMGDSSTVLARTGVDRDVLADLAERAVGRRPVGERQTAALRETALHAGVPTASHDTSNDTELADALALKLDIAEFPATLELAQAFREAGVGVMYGAPNLVRGGSHLGLVSARAAVEAGVADMLVSDYHYPSLLQAPFVLAAAGVVGLAEAWALVSSTPAHFAGLDDRGRLEAGARADVVVVDPPEGDRPASVRAVVAGGRVVHRRSVGVAHEGAAR